MSRLAKKPVAIPKDVTVTKSADNKVVTIKGKKGELSYRLTESILVDITAVGIQVNLEAAADTKHYPMLGTTIVLLSNHMKGVSEGFEKKLELRGVGYRAKMQGKILNLTLGFSHPVNFEVPEGITIEAPSQTEITVKGISKQQVGQVAANIRAYRPPECYKGKGVRYAGEHISLKETKKK